jgi:natural product biosynthesis luciferase-like monooxygenase protein/amino acid adenylation domain-containing protein/non-ribosomal peptide synthase protein (TIGR01720 family)
MMSRRDICGSPDTTLPRVLHERAKHTPNREVFEFIGDDNQRYHLTYAALEDQAKRIGANLQSNCVQGETVLLAHPPGLSIIAAMFGCFYAGVIPVPVNAPRHRRQAARLEAIAADAGANLLLTSSETASQLGAQLSGNDLLQNLRIQTTDDLPEAGSWHMSEPALESIAYLQYTSGSTASPKGVMVTHANLFHHCDGMKTVSGVDTDSTIVGWLPHFHDMGILCGIMLAIYSDAKSILISPSSFLRSPLRWLEIISQRQGTHSIAPNFAYELCTQKITPSQRASLDLSDWRVAGVGAEPVRQGTLERFTEAFASSGFNPRAFSPAYGLAENTLAVSSTMFDEQVQVQICDAVALQANKVVELPKAERQSAFVVSCGRLLPGTKVQIVNPDFHTPCAVDEVGEIWVSSGSVALGYWHRPDETREIFQAHVSGSQDGPFLRTGDLGFLRDQQLYITGRLKELIIIRGRNYYPSDIEQAVEQTNDALRIGCGAAFSIDVDGGEQLVIVYELDRTHRRKPVKEILDRIRQTVAESFELSVFEIILVDPGKIPKTSSGKVQRGQVRQQYLAGHLQGIRSGQSEAIASGQQNNSKDRSSHHPMQFSLFYFSSNEADSESDKYTLFLEGARFADKHGFQAVWVPERHFHAFGGIYPSPSVLASALAVTTERVRIRAGSVVLPLHDPVRVTEEWSIVDNLSKGRVDLAFARGWNPNDFVLSPHDYANSVEVLYRKLGTVRALWAGESVTLPNGAGKDAAIRIYPKPIQKDLPVWITCTGGIERFIEAGEGGWNVLTALLFQSIEDIGAKIAAYREARARRGHEPHGHVTLMMHTFVGADGHEVREKVRGPFIEYLKSSVDLWRQGSKSLSDLPQAQREEVLNVAFERYYHTAALFGTPAACVETIEKLKIAGVDEVACLIDFGLDIGSVLKGLEYLHLLKQETQGVGPAEKNANRPSAIPVAQAREGGSARSLVEEYVPVGTAQQTRAMAAAASSHGFASLPGKTIPGFSQAPEGNGKSRRDERGTENRVLLRKLEQVIIRAIVDVTGTPAQKIETGKNFFALGINSLQTVEIVDKLQAEFGVTFSAALLFEFPTIEKLVAALVHSHGSYLQSRLTVEPKIKETAVKEVPSQTVTLEDTSSAECNLKSPDARKPIGLEDIAIIGLACRMPGAGNLASYWNLLCKGRDAVTEVPADHWDWRAHYDSDRTANNKTYSRWGGFLSNIDLFDATFFNISPQEARLVDPQQRIFLETAWETLEHSGYSPESLALERVGVFAGASYNGYYQRIAQGLTQSDHSAGVGNQNAIIANRVSFFLNLHGPSMLVDTMCSSSLVALHLACQSLKTGECSFALAGGVNILLSPENYVAMSRMNAHSPDGRCKAFDHRANGIVFGEGAGAVLLKPLARALEDRDTVYAVIKGSAINHGGQANGLLAPNPEAQAQLVRRALDAARVSASSISYVEAHGTGTALGDPIEVEGLSRAFQRDTANRQFCRIGSVKGNIGHLESAAGIASVIKVVLSMQHRQLPATLHFEKLNPMIPFADSPFLVNTELSAWNPTGDVRRAGVSSFGIGGSNAHVILEEAPLQRGKKRAEQSRPGHLLALSAKTDSALRILAGRYADFLEENPAASLSDLCFTANTGRSHFSRRLAIPANSIEMLRTKLESFHQGIPTEAVFVGNARSGKRPEIAFLFTGQSSQYRGMGQYLYKTENVFRRAVEYCQETLAKHLPQHSSDVPFLQAGDDESFHDPVLVQVSLFILQYALVELWKSWGIVPDIVCGHSLGEYAAAHTAGVFKLEDGLKLVSERARLMREHLLPGTMAVVFAEEVTVRPYLISDQGQVSIAAINGPGNTVISGEESTVARVLRELESRGIQCEKLNVTHAFHSPLLEPILQPFESVAKKVSFSTPLIPMVSGLTGELFQNEAIPDAAYWVRQMRTPIQYLKIVNTLTEQGCTIFLEIGPSNSLLNMAARCPQVKEVARIPSLTAGKNDWDVLSGSLANLYSQGVPVHWAGFESGNKHNRIALPSYPFEKRRFWIDTKPADEFTGQQANKELSTEVVATGQSATHVVGQLQTLRQAMSMNGKRENANSVPAMSDSDRRREITRDVTQILAALLQRSPEEIDIDEPFLEMGADSIVLLAAIRKIQSRFGVEVAVRQLFEQERTLEALAGYIDSRLPVQERQSISTATPEAHLPHGNIHENHPGEPAISEPVNTGQETPNIERVLTEQMSVMAKVFSQQMDFLKAMGQSSTAQNEQPKLEMKPGDSAQASSAAYMKSPLPQVEKTKQFSPYTPIRPGDASLSPQRHIQELAEQYVRKTRVSRELTQNFRRVLADNRASAGFRFSTKEMLYPIHAERSSGSKIYDVDGNEYLDLAMGFGTNLFGHNPSFVIEAIEQQLKLGMQLGPQSPLAGQVAQSISELTGMARIAFCNSGTEAVMTALRLARTATGRRKIALFAGSYHGASDGVLARADEEALNTAPMAPGVTPGAVEDVLVLEYGEARSLEVLQRHAHQLAGVLVEPVQSRRPDLQPKFFLEQLRELTLEHDVPLIFDEMITGFRLAAGGAKEWFGVSPDIALYGKIVGGGMPIGVIAGSPAYLDGIDGGFWSYGDSSHPSANTTFFAGTFCKHPLAMAAAKAVLSYMQAEGPGLQQRLNARTAALADTLNAFFTAEQIPMKVVHCGSLFRFSFIANMDLFFYYLLQQGVYIWEGRTCFLSTAHSTADLDALVEHVREAALKFKNAGILPSQSHKTEFSRSAPAVDVPTNGDSSKSHAARNAAQFELSDGQQQIWALTHLNDGAARAYVLSTEIELAGRLRLRVMQQAFEMVANRHEALRACIDAEGRLALVSPFVPVELNVQTAAEWPESDQKAGIERWREIETNRSFDPENGPLFRICMLETAAQRHRLIFSVHHIIADGLSLNIILGELAYVYAALCNGESPSLPAPMQFSEYLESQKSWQSSERSEIDEAFWMRCFENPAPIIEIAGRKPRPEEKTFRGARVSLVVDEKLTAQIREEARRCGSTQFMMLYAAWVAFIARLSDSDDIVIGFPSAGRALEGSETVFGYCINMLPVRSRINLSVTAAEHIATVKAALLQALEHGDYPLSKLVRRLNPARDPGRTLLFNISFNFDRAMEAPGMHELKINHLLAPVLTAKFDLEMNVFAKAHTFVFELEYSSDLYDNEIAERLLHSFISLTRNMAQQPTTALSDLSLMSQAERDQVLREWGEGERKRGEGRVVKLFEEQVERTPNGVAVECEGREMTYGELNRRANQMGRYLKREGVREEELVGVCVERKAELVITLLGIGKAGGGYVALDPGDPWERGKYVLEDAGVRVLVVGKESVEKVKGYEGKVVNVDEEWEEIERAGAGEGEEGEREEGVGGENLAYVIYTSGSSGKPKGVEVTEKGLWNYVRWAKEAYGVKEGWRSPVHTSVSFDLTVTSLYPVLVSGGRVEMVRREEGVEGLKKWLEGRREKSLVKMTPSHLQALRGLVGEGWGKEREGRKEEELCVVVGGEALKYGHVEWWRKREGGVRFVNEYGPTETVVGSVMYEVEEGKRGKEKEEVAIGKPIGNTQVYVLDGGMEPVPVGVVGELYIGGEGLARGYRNHADWTAMRFVPNPYSEKGGERLYRTGDKARWGKEGELEYVGRMDEQVKVRGYRIEPGEIEGVLSEHEWVREAAVVVREEEGGEKRLVAYVVGEKGREVEGKELRRYMEERLPEYMVPQMWVMLEKFPLTGHGKLDRKGLPAPERKGVQEGRGKEEGESEVEKKLREIWSELLRVEGIGVEENFFELGGDSILAIQVMGRAGQAGMRMQPRQIFQYPTIRQLALQIEVDVQIQQQTTANKIVEGEIELGAVQHWFLEQELDENWHFNQSVLLEVERGKQMQQWEAALAEVVAQHDELRASFTRDEQTGEWRQYVQGVQANRVSVEERDGQGLGEDEWRELIAREGEHLQRDLDLAKGPQMRAMYFDGGEERGGRLLLIAHHLVIDAVSWRVVIEDLEKALQQVGRGQDVQLGAKTNGYGEWTKAIIEAATTGKWEDEAEYWLEQVGVIQEQPSNNEVIEDENEWGREDEIERVEMAMEELETRELLHELSRGWGAQMQELLLTALAMTWRRWRGDEELLLEMEGHGREEIGKVNVSRTVGWFTALYPLRLRFSGAAGVEALKGVKQQWRVVPGGGVGYGVLRYGLGGKEEWRKKLQTGRKAQVRFNYLGQVEAGLVEEGRSVRKLGEEWKGQERSGKGRRSAGLEFEAVVIGERLKMSWSYNGASKQKSEMERLGAMVVQSLRGLLEEYRSGTTVAWTPKEFAGVRMKQKDVDELRRRLEERGIGGREIEEGYGLTPLQGGMLFHTMYEPGNDYYFVQLSCVLEGKLEEESFKRAWERVVEKYGVLRTQFEWEGLEEAVQVVKRTVKLPWSEEDWRGVGRGEQERRWREERKQDREAGFEVREAPLLRLKMVRVGEEEWKFLISHHHLLLDGWSFGLVLQEVFGLYEEERGEGGGRREEKGGRTGYREYVVWQKERREKDGGKAEEYWRKEMAGLEERGDLGIQRKPGNGKAKLNGTKDKPAEGSSYREKMTKEETERLRGWAQQKRLTLNTIVQGAWALLLSRCSGMEEVMFGMTVSGRSVCPEWMQNIVGLCINTLPLRVKVRESENLEEWLGSLQEKNAELQEYEYTSLADIQRWGGMWGEEGRFETAVVFENYPLAEEKLKTPELEVKDLDVYEHPNFPLTVAVIPGAELLLVFLYDQSLFEEETIAGVARNLRTLLQSMVEQGPNAQISDLQMLGAEERRSLLKLN